MGCQGVTCGNCKRGTQACKITKAKDGKQCCQACVTAYNNELIKK